VSRGTSGTAVISANNAGRSNHASTARRIEQLLREQLRPVALEVRDESAAHAGHAGGGGKGHFRVRIVSTSFVGLTPLQRHRRIHAVLASLWQHELHALAMEALTPDEVTN
jgi:BolA family transcriptional regulator, general stress-responsive regulator